MAEREASTPSLFDLIDIEGDDELETRDNLIEAEQFGGEFEEVAA
jgi:hypothetical protein